MTAQPATLASAPPRDRADREPFQHVGAWPVISRELGTEARRNSNYQIRILGGAGLMALFAMLMRNDTTASASLSIRLFTAAHTLLWSALWLISPILTADAISREKREETLGLLFSTNLTTRSIVLGKSFVHIARLATLWLAAFPVVLTPVLLGGVTGLDLLSAFVMELCAGLWALAAGLAVSSLVRSPVAALLLAEILALAFSQVFQMLIGFAWFSQLRFVGLSSSLGIPSAEFLRFSLTLCTGVGRSASGWSRSEDRLWLWVLEEMLLVSIIVFILLLKFAASRTERVWRQEPPSARQLRRRQTWLVPRFWLGRFRHQRQHRLEQNPLGWLQQQSVWVRVSKLGWCGLVLLIDSVVILSSQPWTYFDRAQIWISLLLSLHMTFVSVTIFRQERNSGVLELLLVTPMSVDQIVYRELCAFWRRFFIPVLLLISLAQLIVWLDMANMDEFDFRAFLLVNLLITPVIGSYASAKFGGFAAAFLFTAFFSLGLPLFGPELGPDFQEHVTSLDLWFISIWPSPPREAAMSDLFLRFLQVIVALGCWLGFRTILQERSPACARASNPQ